MEKKLKEIFKEENYKVYNKIKGLFTLKDSRSQN